MYPAATTRIFVSMFGLFKNTAPPCPLKDDRRERVEKSLGRLVDLFGMNTLLQCRVLIPHHSDFPIRYDGHPQTARDTIDIIARQMDVDPEEITLHIYQEAIQTVSTGHPMGGNLYLGREAAEPSGEPSWRKEEDGKYHIWLEEVKLRQPEGLVAVLARDLAHIKLLGEGRVRENDELLVDMTTLGLGLGVFNANAAFYSQRIQAQGEKSNQLTQMEWGYGLALYARLRREERPGWVEYLCKNIKSDFLKSEQYLQWVE